MRLFPGKQKHIPAYPAQPPEILVFQVCPVAPPEYFQGDPVLSGLQIRCYVKPGFQFAVFRIPHEHPVDPQAQVGGNRSEMDKDLFSGPFLRHGKGVSVKSRMVVDQGYYRRIGAVLIGPGIPYVQVQRIAVSVQFPQSRDRHEGPASVIVCRVLKPGISLVGMIGHGEFPETSQVFVAGRRFPDAVMGQLKRFVSKIRGVHGGAVDLVHFRILPYFPD